MIWDSGHIKRDLDRALDEIETRVATWVKTDDPEADNSSDAAFLALEREVFWIAFAIRKLFEAKTKLSDQLEREQFQLRFHPRLETDAIEDVFTAHHIERFYDLGTSQKRTLGARRICDQLIHSWQFMPATDDEQRKMEALYFNSDRSRQEGLYEIEWDEFRRLVVATITDNIVDMRIHRPTGEMVKDRGEPVPKRV